MVPLGLGQAILGGMQTLDNNYQKKIYFMTCTNRNCFVTTLSKELSDPLSRFVAIPIPDLTALCISKGPGKMFNLRLKIAMFFWNLLALLFLNF